MIDYEFPTHGRIALGVLLMARGQHTIEVLETGGYLLLLLARGCLQVTRHRTDQPSAYCLHATPKAPLFIINPGTYTIVAERSTVGLRGLRRK